LLLIGSMFAEWSVGSPRIWDIDIAKIGILYVREIVKVPDDSLNIYQMVTISGWPGNHLRDCHARSNIDIIPEGLSFYCIYGHKNYPGVEFHIVDGQKEGDEHVYLLVSNTEPGDIVSFWARYKDMICLRDCRECLVDTVYIGCNHERVLDSLEVEKLIEKRLLEKLIEKGLIEKEREN